MQVPNSDLPSSDDFFPAPSLPTQVSTLPSSTNLLHVSVENLKDDCSQETLQLLFATTADRRLHIITPDSTFSIVKSISHLQDSPTLSCVSLGKDYLRTITSGMSGQVVVYDHKKDMVLDERRDHNKYVVKVAICDENEATVRKFSKIVVQVVLIFKS